MDSDTEMMIKGTIKYIQDSFGVKLVITAHEPNLGYDIVATLPQGPHIFNAKVYVSQLELQQSLEPQLALTDKAIQAAKECLRLVQESQQLALNANLAWDAIKPNYTYKTASIPSAGTYIDSITNGFYMKGNAFDEPSIIKPKSKSIPPQSLAEMYAQAPMPVKAAKKSATQLSIEKMKLNSIKAAKAYTASLKLKKSLLSSKALKSPKEVAAPELGESPATEPSKDSTEQ